MVWMACVTGYRRLYFPFFLWRGDLAIICGVQEETRNNVFRGKGGQGPPILVLDYFQPTRKGGGGLSPPKYLVPQWNLIANARENAGKCWNMLENAGKCRK
jgi:hypothetical protein